MAQESPEYRKLKFRCAGCRLALQALATPADPFIAKVKCPQCDRVNEVQTRDSVWGEIDAAKERGIDRQQFDRKKPVTNSRLVTPSPADIRRFG